jgi:uncharacterized repeat protein (TIGR01451 family)
MGHFKNVFCFAFVAVSVFCLTRLYAIVIDGTNDFTDDGRILTTTAGYTNWIHWDSNVLYIGYYGEDVDANIDTTMLLVYLSTNVDSGSAYGEIFDSQRPVLPFKADTVFQYITTNGWRSASWDGTAWNWDNALGVTSNDLKAIGNFLEFSIAKSNLNDTPYLAIYLQFVNSAASYGAIPSGTLADGFKSNPSNFISFGTDIWLTNAVSSSNIYRTNDNVFVLSNNLLAPANYQTNVWGENIVLSNYAADDIGIFKIEFCTNSGIYSTTYTSNTNTPYTSILDTSLLNSGTYQIYSIAYDTRNSLYSTSNILEILSAPDLSITKTVDSIELLSTNFCWPGSLVTYKITYSNLGTGYATNVVIFERIPGQAAYYTNYPGSGTTDWQTEFAHIPNPDQTYDSADYDSAISNIKWVRWKKASLAADEDNKTIFLGVTID